MGTLEAKVGTVEARVTFLEEEVKLLKKMVKALISRPANPGLTGPPIQIVTPLQINSPPVVAPQCNCPISSGSHTRGPGCHDTWITC
jgi:hypothetical protein